MRPWAEQLAADDESFRAQLAYLLERSPFYREKLAGADTSGGLAGIAQLPLTAKDELRATRTRENPIGRSCSSARCASKLAVRARIGTAFATTGA